MLVSLLQMSVANASPDPLGIVGLWAITETHIESTCEGPTPGIQAYTWLVSARSDGLYGVQVTGTTEFSDLTGKLDESFVLRLSSGGDSQSITTGSSTPTFIRAQSSWTLRLENDVLVGKRIVTSYDKKATHTKSGADAVRYVLCYFELAITSSRISGTAAIPF